MSVYFDNAATTFPKPEEVYQFMDTFYRAYGGNAGRGQYMLAAEASRMMAETRQLLQRTLDCENKDIIFTPSDTLALNMIIQGSFNSSIRTIYISPYEHNSVTRILHHFAGSVEVKILPVKDNFTLDFPGIAEQFNETHPDMVIMSHVSNVCGLIAPIEQVFSEAKKYHAITVVDMAQSAGLISLRAGSDDIDYAVFSGHKTLYGPFGIAGFAKKKGIALEPIIFGGTGVDSANQGMPDILPYRYEAGSQNIQAVAGLHAALTWLADKTDIMDVEKANHRKLLQILGRHSNIHIVGPKNRENCIGVVSCVFDGYSPNNMGDVFDELEIAVRTGLECAPLAHKTLGTFPAGTVRFSVGYFTKENDFEALEQALTYIEENS